MTASNAAELYAWISRDTELTQSLFRQALQDPSGALSQIVAIGEAQGLPVTAEEVREHLAGTTMISIAHRPAVSDFHNRVLELRPEDRQLVAATVSR